jgi:hypothetical protein
MAIASVRLEPFVRILEQPSRIVMHSFLRELISRTPHLRFPPSISDDDNAVARFAPSELMATTCLDFLLLPYFRNTDVRTDLNVADEDADDFLKHFHFTIFDFDEKEGLGKY